MLVNGLVGLYLPGQQNSILQKASNKQNCQGDFRLIQFVILQFSKYKQHIKRQIIIGCQCMQFTLCMHTWPCHYNVIVITEPEEANLRFSNLSNLFKSVMKLAWRNPHIRVKCIWVTFFWVKWVTRQNHTCSRKVDYRLYLFKIN